MTWRHVTFIACFCSCRGKNLLIERSAFCGFIRNKFLFVLLRRDDFSQRREKSSEKVRPERGTASLRQQILRRACEAVVPPLREYSPCPPRLGVKVGAGKIKYSGIIMFCRNAFGYRKWVRQQLRGYTRGGCFTKTDWIPPARVGNEKFFVPDARKLSFPDSRGYQFKQILRSNPCGRYPSNPHSTFPVSHG